MREFTQTLNNVQYRGKFYPYSFMDVSKELEIIDARRWNNPALKIAATNIILALKAITDYATSANKDVGEISPKELLDNIIKMD